MTTEKRTPEQLVISLVETWLELKDVEQITNDAIEDMIVGLFSSEDDFESDEDMDAHPNAQAGRLLDVGESYAVSHLLQMLHEIKENANA